MNYPVKEGKYGPIYQIAKGIRISRTKYETYQLTLQLNGQKKRSSFSGDDALEKAVQAAELLSVKLNLSSNKPQPQNDITVRSFSELYLKNNRKKWRIGTYDRYESLLRDFINPVIGEYPINKVTRSQIRSLLVGVHEIRAPKTVELVHAVISGMYSDAIDMEYTDKNPAVKLLKRILPPSNKRNQKKPDPFPKKELEKAIKSAWSNLPADMALIQQVMAQAGFRLGEAIAMKAENIDQSNKMYHITESLRHGRIGEPKSGSRLVDIPDDLMIQIDHYLIQLKKQALKNGTEVDYLFPGVTQRMVQRSVERVCRIIRVRRRTPHDYRHSYATILLMDHFSPAYVQKQLGHHSITETVGTYGHWIPGEGKKNLDSVFQGRVKRPGASSKNSSICSGL